MKTQIKIQKIRATKTFATTVTGWHSIYHSLMLARDKAKTDYVAGKMLYVYLLNKAFMSHVKNGWIEFYTECYLPPDPDANIVYNQDRGTIECAVEVGLMRTKLYNFEAKVSTPFFHIATLYAHFLEISNLKQMKIIPSAFSDLWAEKGIIPPAFTAFVDPNLTDDEIISI